jgi:hypothetical protein
MALKASFLADSDSVPRTWDADFAACAASDGWAFVTDIVVEVENKSPDVL